jgi:hypothetical protein
MEIAFSLLASAESFVGGKARAAISALILLADGYRRSFRSLYRSEMGEQRMENLRRAALGRLLFLLLFMAVLLFLAAGTIRYWQAWTYLIVFFRGGLADDNLPHET